MSIYTGVGSREVPPEILTLMNRFAQMEQSFGNILRSGGAKGSDSAFEAGAGNLKEIYYANQANEAAMEIAKYFHPAWHKCSNYARRLHGRNAFQVLGMDLNTPSKFLICWTPDGCKSHATRNYTTGGTGTAISIAEAHGVPIVNLYNYDDYQHVLNYVNSNTP